MGNDTKKADSIIVQLEELLDRVKATEKTIFMKVTAGISDDVQLCQDSIRSIQNITSDLRAYKTQKDKLAIDATCLEQSAHAPETLPRIRTLIKTIQQHWNISWKSANLCLEKARKTLLVLQSTRSVD